MLCALVSACSLRVLGRLDHSHHMFGVARRHGRTADQATQHHDHAHYVLHNAQALFWAIPACRHLSAWLTAFNVKTRLSMRES